MTEAPLILISDLRVAFGDGEDRVIAVHGVDLEVGAAETLGLVGESGCGKSVTCMSVLGLLPPNGRVISGKALFDGGDLLELTEVTLNKVRGHRIAYIFQDPMTSLNPVKTVGRQISESLVVHLDYPPAEARRKSIELLRRVGIPNPSDRIDDYPHQLSGGMNQRAMIAMALACEPTLLIADEPTTALDVTIQAQILDLLRSLRDDDGMSMILVTHDLGIIAEMTDRMAVMYAGCVVEQGATRDVFRNPRHPYTRGLLASLLRIDSSGGRLTTIDGTVPGLDELPAGCHFFPRCQFGDANCLETKPTMTMESEPGEHQFACFHPEN